MPPPFSTPDFGAAAASGGLIKRKRDDDDGDYNAGGKYGRLG